jgi:hypothetical protein
MSPTWSCLSVRSDEAPMAGGLQIIGSSEIAAGWSFRRAA